MDGLSLLVSENRRDLRIVSPEAFKGRLLLAIPEFYGRSGNRPFAVMQELLWTEEQPLRRADFSLDASEGSAAIEFKGSFALKADDEIEWSCTLRNMKKEDISAAHHTVMLDTSQSPGLQDPSGDRTFLHTSTGWVSMADLARARGQDPLHAPFRVGANYADHTVIWKVVARFDADRRHLVAFALSRGYAFSTDHPEWGLGLLAGSRWGMLHPGEALRQTGRLYVVQGDLETVRERYARDFR